MLCNTLLPAWYNVENENVQAELKAANYLAITWWLDQCCSGPLPHCNSTLYKARQLKGKVLHTRAVYESQTGAFVAEEIGGILEEFDSKSKVGAITVDNAANMEVAVRRMHILTLGCFAHSLNLGAQKLYTVTTIAKWTARIQSVVVWLKEASLAKPVLKEKQKLLGWWLTVKQISQLRKQSYFTELKFRGQTSDGCTVCVVVQGLPQHAVILDVRTRWNTFYLMVERFVEQYPAIQAASLDPRLKKSMERDRYWSLILK